MTGTTRRGSLVAVLALAVLIAGCSSSGSTPQVQPSVVVTSPEPSASAPTSSPTASALDRFYKQKLKWHGCGSGFQCATMTVPLDYTKPSGETITIAVDR
ncbi:MAG: hypothetical protein QOE64_2317, partial [Frankiales bacterium]|nr:hypothetical protein [Frankiales bacterium]